MTRRLNDDSHFPSLSNRLNSFAHDYTLNTNVNEQSYGVTVVVEKLVNYSFIGENPLVQIKSDHAILETQLTSRVVTFIPGFKVGDYINITISGDQQDIENVLVYELLEDPSGENFLITEMYDE